MNQELCERIKWDSEFFGLKIARVRLNRMTDQEARLIEEWSADNKIDCLYFLSDWDDKSIRLAEEHHFHLVDIRVTLAKKLSDIPSYEPPIGENLIREANERDIQALRAIAKSCHTDSRYLYDGRFPREACDEFYQTWIENSCKGFADLVLVAERQDRLAGYVACHLRGDREGQIGLIAVSAEFQGLGLGKSLLASADDWFAEHGVKNVTVVTQGNNIGAQCLYQRLGFTTHSMQLWYHRWFSSGGTQTTL